MVEFEKIRCPTSISEAPVFCAYLEHLMNVIGALERCVPSAMPEKLQEMWRETLQTPEFRSIVAKTRSRKRAAYIHFS